MEKRYKINNFRNANMGSYYNQIKTKKPEITTLSWMPDSKYNNIIIKYMETGVKIVLDDLESLIWRYIFEDFGTVEQLVDFASEKGVEPKKTVQIIYSP
ncbi:MAG: hypothetical protein SCH70_14420 [Candidatus Methanoperedens sp.]|nr:hypothetical protein [Candidatus Methanoperedens sp.]